MRLASFTTLIFGGVMLLTGLLGWLTAGPFSPAVGVAMGVTFVLLGLAYLRGRVAAGYVSAAGILLAAIYFASRFVATESIVPSGVLLVFSFLSLFLVLLGFFIALSQR